MSSFASAKTSPVAVPPSATPWAPKRRMSGAGSAETRIEPSAYIATSTPNAELESAKASFTSGRRGSRFAHRAPFTKKNSEMPARARTV